MGESLEDRRMMTAVPGDLNPGDPYYLAFVTSQQSIGFFPTPGPAGGTAAADAFVDSLACTATLNDGSCTIDYRAIISDSTQDANNALGLAPGIPIYNTNLDRIANDVSDLWDGTIQNPIMFDENGVSISDIRPEVWTGTRFNGTDTTVNGGDWSGNDFGTHGIAYATNASWIENEPQFHTDGAQLRVYGISDRLRVPEDPGDETGSIHGQKWHDLNGDGIRDPNEPGLDGWTIIVIDPATGNPVLDPSTGLPITQVTHSMDMDGDGVIDPIKEQGLYWIDGVPAGDYFVDEIDQQGWQQTSPSPSVDINGFALADNYYQAFVGDTTGSSVSSIGPVIAGPGVSAANSILNGTSTLGAPQSTTEDYLYLTAWSDDGVAQGLLADLTLDGNPFLSGNPFWRVHATGLDLDSTVGPTAASVSSEIASATWVAPTNGPTNGAGLYGVIGTKANINASANWTWFDSGNQTTSQAPFRNGFDHEEYLIFRLPTGAGKHLVTVKPGEALEGVDFGNKGTGSIHGNKFIGERNLSMFCGKSTIDNFASPPEATNHSPGLAAFYSNNGIPTKRFDQTGINRHMGCSFENLPSNIVAANFETAAAPLGSGLDFNDTITLGLHNNTGTPFSTWGAFFDNPSNVANSLLNHTSGTGWNTGNYSYEVFNLDLGNLPPMAGTTTNLISDMNANGFLDMRIQDDTVVDYAKLDLTTGFGAAGWVIEAVDANGNVVATAITMADDPSTPDDETGMFWLENLAPGTYTIQEQQQPGWTLTSPSAGSYTITVGPGGTVEDVNFVNEKLGSIHGQKLHKVRKQITRRLGLNDNYAAPSEVTNPSPALQNFITLNGINTKNYDNATINRSVADSFQGLPTGVTVTGATVRIHMRPGNSGLSTNDTVSVGIMDPAYTGTGSPWRQVGLNNVAQGFHIGSGYVNSILPNPWDTANYGDTAVTIAITNTDVLNGIGTYGLLDVYLQDDTTVDFMEICLHYETLEGLNNWTINVSDSTGTTVGSQVTHSMDLNGDGTIDPQTERGLYWIEDVAPGTYDVSEVMQPWWTAVNPVGGTQSVTVQPGQTLEHVNFVNRHKFIVHHLPCFFKFEPVGPFIPGRGDTTVIEFDDLSGEMDPGQFAETHGVSFSGAIRTGVYDEGSPSIPQLDGYDGEPVDVDDDADGIGIHPHGDEVLLVELVSTRADFEIHFDSPVSYAGGLVAIPAPDVNSDSAQLQFEAFDAEGNSLNHVVVELRRHDDPEALEANWSISGSEDNISTIKASGNEQLILDVLQYQRKETVVGRMSDEASGVDAFIRSQEQPIQTVSFGGGDFAILSVEQTSSEIPEDHFAGEFGLTIRGLSGQRLLLAPEGSASVGEIDGYNGELQSPGDSVLVLIPENITEPSSDECELGHDNDCDDGDPSTSSGVQLDFDPPVSAVGGLVAFLDGDPDRPVITGRVQAFSAEGDLLSESIVNTQSNLSPGATEGFWQVGANGEEIISSLRIEPLDENGQAAHDTGLVLDSLSFTRSTIPVIPPTIKGIEVSATTWSESFLQALGESGRGYAMPQGEGQLAALPWKGVNQFHLELSEDVGAVMADDVQIIGLNGEYTHTVEYDSSTRVVTVEVEPAIELDKVMIVLSDSVTDSSGHHLNGEWNNGGQNGNSGDSAQGGQFAYQINVLAGDTTQSGAAAVNDVGRFRSSLGASLTDERYDILADTNGSGGVSVDDLFALRDNLGRRLPTEDPQAPQAAVALAAVQGPAKAMNVADLGAVVDMIHGNDMRDDLGEDAGQLFRDADDDFFADIAKSKRRALIA